MRVWLAGSKAQKPSSERSQVWLIGRGINVSWTACVLVSLISLGLVPKHASASQLYVTELATIGGKASDIIFQIDPATGAEIVSTGNYVTTFGVAVPNETDIAFSPDGKLYVTELATIGGKASDIIFQIDPATGAEIAGTGNYVTTFGVTVPTETSAAFSPDGKLYVTELATIGGKVTDIIFQIDPATGAEVAGTGNYVTTFGETVLGKTSIAFSPDGRLYATELATVGGKASDIIFQIDPATGAEIANTGNYVTTFGVAVAKETSIAFSPDGKLYVTELATIGGKASDIIFQIDPATGAEIAGTGNYVTTFGATVANKTSIAFSPDLNITAVPEPQSFTLMVALLAGFGLTRFRLPRCCK
jgi:hypothetical protein